MIGATLNGYIKAKASYGIVSYHADAVIDSVFVGDAYYSFLLKFTIILYFFRVNLAIK